MGHFLAGNFENDESRRISAAPFVWSLLPGPGLTFLGGIENLRKKRENGNPPAVVGRRCLLGHFSGGELENDEKGRKSAPPLV